MKHLTFTLFFSAFLLLINGQAQTFNTEASNDFTVWTVSGKAEFSSKSSSEPSAVMPGMKIKDDATINLGGKSSVKLIRDKDIITIDQSGSHNLNGDLINKVTEKQTPATVYFFEKLISSAKYAGKNMLLESGSGYGTESGKQAKKDQGTGYGTESGKQAKKDQGTGYGTEDGKQAKKDNGGGYGTEDGKQAKKDNGGGYGTEEGKQAKKDNGGGYGTEEGKQAKKDQGTGYGKKDKEAKSKIKKAKKELKADKHYKSSKKNQKLLMRATAIEQLGYMAEANKCYKKALSKNPQDRIANQMYAAFLDSE